MLIRTIIILLLNLFGCFLNILIINLLNNYIFVCLGSHFLSYKLILVLIHLKMLILLLLSTLFSHYFRKLSIAISFWIFFDPIDMLLLLQYMHFHLLLNVPSLKVLRVLITYFRGVRLSINRNKRGIWNFLANFTTALTKSLLFKLRVVLFGRC